MWLLCSCRAATQVPATAKAMHGTLPCSAAFVTGLHHKFDGRGFWCGRHAAAEQPRKCLPWSGAMTPCHNAIHEWDSCDICGIRF